MNNECMNNRRLVGARVSELRRAQGLSQRKLAQMVSMDHSYICKLEAGNENPALDTLSRLAIGLDVKVVRFFEGNPGKDYVFLTDV